MRGLQYDLPRKYNAENRKEHRNTKCQKQIQIKASSYFLPVLLSQILRNHDSRNRTDC